MSTRPPGDEAANAGTRPLPEPGAPREARPRHVAVLTLTLAGIALLVLTPEALSRPETAVLSLAGVLLLPLFGLAEVVVIHLPTLRNAHGHTLREIPAVIGLSLLAPLEYTIAYVVGSVVALFLWTHMRGVKLAFNTALFACEAAIGVTVYHALLGAGDPLSPLGWLAALAAVLTTDMLSAVAITLAITFTEGQFDSEVMRETLRSGTVAAVINTCVALLVVTLLLVHPSSLPLLAVIVVLLVMAYRVYVALARGGARTQLLYRFVERTAGTQDPDDVVRVMLSEAAGLMRAESAHLLEVVEEQPAMVLRCRTVADGAVRTDLFQEELEHVWWAGALEGRSVLLSHDGSEQDTSDDSGPAAAEGVEEAAETAPQPSAHDRLHAPRDGVAAPLPRRSGARAALVVCDRAFEQETFGPEDQQVFETLAAHAAVALERAQSVERLERMVEERAHDALHDPLSGLPNRRAFNEAVAEAIGEAVEAHDSPFGVVLLLDLDDFKDVNDTLGHSAGDRLITVSGERLTQRSGGMVARLGGDEFAVLLPGMTMAEGMDHARMLHGVLSAPVPLENVELIVSSSIGVAEYTSSAVTAEELLAQADVAMYTAKAERSGVAMYRSEEGDSVARRLALAADLPAAIAGGDLELWFQPQADTRTGRVTGFEALLRWRHPTFGMVPPPEVIAVANRTGRVRMLTDSMLRQALTARRQWEDAGHRLQVSVNVTPGDIADTALVTRVRQELARSLTPAKDLVLEVTESDAMKDPVRSLEVLTALSELGVTLSIDDFGTGYSSLSYLDRLPVHEVKIDQSFVLRVENGAADATIMSATVGLAHELGLRVVAEGIETESARTLVRELGVDVFQGYGLARPMPADQVLVWLDRAAMPPTRTTPHGGIVPL